MSELPAAAPDYWKSGSKGGAVRRGLRRVANCRMAIPPLSRFHRAGDPNAAPLLISDCSWLVPPRLPDAPLPPAQGAHSLSSSLMKPPSDAALPFCRFAGDCAATSPSVTVLVGSLRSAASTAARCEPGKHQPPRPLFQLPLSALSSSLTFCVSPVTRTAFLCGETVSTAPAAAEQEASTAAVDAAAAASAPVPGASALCVMPALSSTAATSSRRSAGISQPPSGLLQAAPAMPFSSSFTLKVSPRQRRKGSSVALDITSVGEESPGLCV
mmetsp:Transcript_25053/g.78746  ORF Transcript_25053/g.78746 Transcript_25053/m.78746 type:complete len:270 (-) Transcript_25053:58-867(-)